MAVVKDMAEDKARVKARDMAEVKARDKEEVEVEDRVAKAIGKHVLNRHPTLAG